VKPSNVPLFISFNFGDVMRMMERIGNIFSKYFKRISQTIFSTKVYLNTVQFFGGLSVLLGSIMSTLGFYGLATEGVTFTIGHETIGFDPFLAGFLLVIVGELLTFEGIIILKALLKISRLSIISIIFGFCSLNIPAIFLGFGYSLVAGVFAVIFGFLWLITVLAWLQRGE